MAFAGCSTLLRRERQSAFRASLFFDADDDGDRSNDADAGDDQHFPMDLYPLDEIATFLHFIAFTSSSRPSSRARWSYCSS